MTAYEVHWTINGTTEPMPNLFTSRAVATMRANTMQIGHTGMLMADHYTYTIVAVTVEP